MFIDLDSSGGWRSYINQEWMSGPITMNNACPTGQPLWPRSNGYTVGVTMNPNGDDRLIIIGGADVSGKPRW